MHIFTSLRYDRGLAAVSASLRPETYPPPNGSPYYLLAYHRDRLLAAARAFGWNEAVDKLRDDPADVTGHSGLVRFTEGLDEAIPDKNQAWRLRVTLDRDGHLQAEANPTTPFSSCLLVLPPASLSTPPSFETLPSLFASVTGNDLDGLAAPWNLYLDTKPTTPTAYTTHKTSVRDVYNVARARAGITSLAATAEVLIYNPTGEIMEGSITTPYFRRRQQRQGNEAVHSGRTDDRGGEPFEWVTPPLTSGGNAGTTRRYALERGFCTEGIVRIDELVPGEECWISNGVRGFIRAVLVFPRKPAIGE